MTSYRAGLEEFQRAAAAWREAGEPQSGPLLDDVNSTRERLIRAQPPDNGGTVVTGLYRDHDKRGTERVPTRTRRGTTWETSS